MKPNILDFLNAMGVEVLPHEVEPYLEFDGEKQSKHVVIVKSRQMRGTSFCQNVAVFDVAARGLEREMVTHAFPRQGMVNHTLHGGILASATKPYTYLNERLEKQDGRGLFSFKGGNRYYAFSSSYADCLHGVASDFLIRDEVGMFSEDGLMATDACLSASKHKLALDVGTPLGRTVLNKLWQGSDKRKYFYCCIDCGEYFQPTLELLCGIRDIKCPNCEKEQGKMEAARDGKWVAMRNPRGKFCKVGYHFTQLISPVIDTMQIMRLKEQLSPEHFRAEILGEI